LKSQHLLAREVALSLFLFLQYCSGDLSFQIEPKSRECFFEDLEKDGRFGMEFEVVRGGLLDIKLVVLDPSNQVIYERMAFFNKPDHSTNRQEGYYQFSAERPGSYQICFDNTMSRWTAKVISVRVHAGVKDEPIKYEHLTPVVDSVVKVADELASIEQLQHLMRIRERSHRDASEATNARVQWMSLIESILLISMSVFQLFYIRKWFSDSEKRGRV